MTTLPTGKTDPRGGLALVEVLVAVVLLFAGIAAVLRVYSLAVSALDAADTTVAATLATQERLEGVPVVAATPDRPEAAAVVLPGYECRMEVRSAGDALLEYDVRAGRAGAGAVVRVTTLAVPFSPGRDGSL